MLNSSKLIFSSGGSRAKWVKSTVRLYLDRPVRPQTAGSEWDAVEYWYFREEAYRRLCPGQNCWLAEEGRGRLWATDGKQLEYDVWPSQKILTPVSYAKVRSAWPKGKRYLFFTGRDAYRPDGTFSTEEKFAGSVTIGNDNCPDVSNEGGPYAYYATPHYLPASVGSTATLDPAFALSWPREEEGLALNYRWQYIGAGSPNVNDPRLNQTLGTGATLSITVDQEQADQAATWGGGANYDDTRWRIGFSCVAYLTGCQEGQYDFITEYNPATGTYNSTGPQICQCGFASARWFLYPPDKGPPPWS